MKNVISKSQLRDYFKNHFNLDIVWIEQINGVFCDKCKYYFGILIVPGTQDCFNFIYYDKVHDSPKISPCSSSFDLCAKEMRKHIALRLHTMANLIRL